MAACGLGRELRDAVMRVNSVWGAAPWRLEGMGVSKAHSEDLLRVRVRALLEVYGGFNVLGRCFWSQCWAQIGSLLTTELNFFWFFLSLSTSIREEGKI